MYLAVRDGRQRGSARGQMQEFAAGKFHEFFPKINLKDELQIRNARLPMAPMLPIAIDRESGTSRWQLG